MADDVCKGIRQHLDAYLDGELMLVQHRMVQRHLDECAHCRRICAGLAEVERQMRAIAIPPVPAALLQRVMVAVAEEKAVADVPVWSPLGHAALACSLFLVAGAGLGVLRLGWGGVGAWLQRYALDLATSAGAEGSHLGASLTGLAGWPTTLATGLHSHLASGVAKMQASGAWMHAHAVPVLAAVGCTAVLTWGLLRLWGREVRAFADE